MPVKHPKFNSHVRTGLFPFRTLPIGHSPLLWQHFYGPTGIEGHIHQISALKSNCQHPKKEMPADLMGDVL